VVITPILYKAMSQPVPLAPLPSKPLKEQSEETTQLKPGQGLEAVVSKILHDRDWQPEYIPWEEIPVDGDRTVVGNAGGVHLNQYTVTMQVMVPRTEGTGMKALLQTAKWNETPAQLFLHPDSEIGVEGSSWKRNGNSMDRRSWTTVSMSVDVEIGRVEVLINDKESDPQTLEHCSDLGQVDGPFSIRIDDEPRLCLFGDKDPSRTGGMHVLNFALEARSIPMDELREMHRDLHAGIEKSWAITQPNDGSSVQWQDPLYRLMNGINESAVEAQRLLARHGGDAVAAMQAHNDPLPSTTSFVPEDDSWSDVDEPSRLRS
jgi:hypothetical protein